MRQVNLCIQARQLFRTLTALAAGLLFTVGGMAQNANFVADVTAGCSPLTVRFTDLSTGPIHTYLWNFGNGNTSTFDNVIATYTVPGTYTVTLTVTDTVNGINSIRTETAYITVYEDPTADFSADTLSGCAPLPVTFTDNSTSGSGSIVSYLWDFGDGNVGLGPIVSHTFASAGDYDITLVVTDDNGCTDTRIINDLISVTQVANVDFTASPTSGCTAPLAVQFNSSVTPAGTYSYLWDFGDGNGSTSPNPLHTYLSAGDHEVTLTVTDLNGCQEQETKQNFVVINNPTASFTGLTTTVCLGQPAQFQNLSVGADSYTWNFGDGNTSTGTNPTHTYSVPGTYTVSLTANNSGGCSDFTALTNVVTVFPAPAPSFTASNNIGCNSPLLVSFNDNSTGNIISWEWDFGNGNFSLGQNPTTTYSTSGTYDVSLTVTTADGCQATELIPNLVVLQEPDADFAVSQDEGCVPLSVNFLDLSTSATDPIVSYVWAFGDGNISGLQNPTNVYTTPGQYTVSLTVTTASGCQDTEIYQYIEAGTRPTAAFDATPRIVCVGQNVSFTDLSTGGATDFSWNFGDGTGNNLQNPNHIYQDTGFFSILHIAEYLGCRDTIIEPQFIQVVGPLVDFTFTPAQGCNPPVDVQFFDISSGANQWFWDFGDGNTSTTQNPNHTFNTAGLFNVTLTVTDSTLGCVNQMTQQIAMTNPIANFSAPTTFGCAPMTVGFVNNSVGTINYLWDFGDGNISTDASPSHTYDSPGVYTVQLVASDGICADTLTLTNYINTVGPSADFTQNIQTGCAPLPVTFTSTSTPSPSSSIVNYVWNFGDGGVAVGPNPTYSFSSAGSWDVTLTVLDANGCQDTITRTDLILPTQPDADFISADTLSCPGGFISFTNLSTGNGLSYLWDFGDGTSSTVPDPTHLYPANANYTVTLVVTDINGCTDIDGRLNYISVGKPTAAFVADSTNATCPPLLVNFSDVSSADVTDYYWDFGDGSISTLANPSKIYARAGAYDITLIVTNALGCRDTVSTPNFINIAGPSGSFSFFPTLGCQPLNVTFTVNSPDPSFTYQWDFGDGVGGAGTTTNHTYTTDTIANPILLVEDAGGCQVPITNPNNITILALPQVGFTANLTEICLGETISFTNTTTSERPIIGYFWEFGDGNTSTDIHPVHTFLDTGTYVVNLQVTTLDGCSDTLATPLEIRVTEPPTAIFSGTPLTGCIPFPVTFTDASTGDFPLVDYEWDFGDGFQDNGQTILPHIYSDAGTHTVTLTVTDSRGCTGTTSRTVTANALPPVDFDAFRYGCAPINVAFSDQTLGASPAVAWDWDFGDGTSSTMQNPNHAYVNDGFYTVSLEVTDANGCVSSLSRTDYIQLEHPVADFSSNSGITCPPQTVSFNDLSIPDTTIGWAWDFGDGTPIDNSQNPTHIYHASDTFDVQLIVTNIFGCADTMYKPNHVITYDPPTATFTVSDTSACVPQNIVFTSTSVPVGAALTDYTWDFGTGSGTTTPTASFLYTVPGIYTASLIVADGNGCRDTATQTIYINPNPTADFVAGDTVGCATTTIPFFDQTTGTNAPVAWEWDFGDGTNGITQNPSNTYFADGTYTVSLKVTDVNGCQDSITKTDYIVLDHPDAEFAADQVKTCPGTDVTFNDLSTGNFSMTNWIWDFGDGTFPVATQTPTHVYTSEGFYDVELIVTDALGCQDTLEKSVYIEVYGRPDADFTYTPTQGCQPLTVTFADASTDGPSAPIVSYQWDFGDGGASVVPNPVYVYSTFGTYTVQLVVTDANGCQDSISYDVDVLQIPAVDFVANTEVGCAPTAITFTDITTTPYVKVAWFWDFGDGNTSTSAAPVHTYAVDGNYDVKLVVTDQNGCVDSLTQTQFIRLSHPVADFSLSSAVVCPNIPIGVEFTDTSIPDTTLVSWAWEFGDGFSSTAQNPNHSYAAPGLYTISLITTNILGCRDTLIRTDEITVLDPPVASFQMDDTANCAPLLVNFTDVSTAGGSALTNWKWTFGDGDSTFAQHPSHSWANPGVYTVALTVTDLNGCETTYSETVESYELPVSNFLSADTLGCAPQATSFINLSTSAYPLVEYRWFIGDQFGPTDSIINQVNPTYTFTDDGDYYAGLVVIDANGCRDSLLRPNYIRLSHPIADFTLDQSDVCPGEPIGVTFTDTSIPDTTLATWAWDFGDGGTSTLQDPSYSYPVPGSYDVVLTVTNVLGCSDSDTLSGSINVSIPPTAALTVADTADCIPFAVNFTDASVQGDGTIIDWRWDFGNGDSSFVQSPSYTFDSAGTYQVRLITSDDNGCADTTYQTIIAFPLPTADLATADTFGCAPHSLTFTDQSTGFYGIATWTWDFGDGGSSGFKNPTYTYAADGTYDVTLTVMDVNGCVDDTTYTNYIRLTHPTADFTQDVREGCPGLSVQFTDLSTPDHPIVGWEWDFGDGGTSTLQHPVHVFDSAGKFDVQLVVTNDQGCTDTIEVNGLIDIFTPPTAITQPLDIAGCTPFEVDFEDQSTIGSSPLVTWAWDFGNGETSNLEDPLAITFAVADTYQVQLIVVDGNGCADTTLTEVISHPLPTADFTANETLSCAPVSISFVDQSTGAFPAVAWEWDFGDGNTSSSQNPVHTYSSNGDYTVTLIMEDVNGCRDTVEKTDYIGLRPPVAAFNTDVAAGCSGLTVNFTDLSTSDTTIVGWVWEFGDGLASTLQNPSHTYASQGNYTVRLVVTNAVGCQDTLELVNAVEVYIPPTPAFTVVDSVGCAPFAVDFTNTSFGTVSAIASYAWDFGDGDTSILENPSHLFPTPGTYTVTLQATDGNGCTAVTTRAITVNDIPTADFFANATRGCTYTPISFTNASTGPAVLVDYLWDFGDGNTSTDASPTHVYGVDGVYDISLIITDVNGCRDTLIRPSYITISRPTAAFTQDQNAGCPDLSVQFTDTSVPDTTLVSWLWDFGDGQSSTQQNPVHEFATAGAYDVTLVVTNVEGCSDTLTVSSAVQIYAPPTAVMTPSAGAGCTPFTVSWTEASSASAGATVVAWAWDFGNGATSGNQHPSYTYDSAGVYTVTLIATDSRGCPDTTTQTVESLVLPTANLVGVPQVGCAPQAINFTDISTGPRNLTSWEWHFGDGNSDSVQHPIHSYLLDGTYTVELRVEDLAGCRDTVVMTDYIRLTRPAPSFTVDDDEVCPGTPIHFTDTSVPDTTLTNWAWDFGDGNTSTAQHPTHSYAAAGTYDVQLIVTNVNGCSDTVLMNDAIEILLPPTPDFAVSDTAGCVPYEIAFTNTSIGTISQVSSFAWSFGDGDSSVLEDPVHTYTAAGTYTITLDIADDNGCTASTSQSITIHEVPTADFFSNGTSGCTFATIDFVNVSLGSAPLVSYAWSFGDGDSSSNQTPSHVYSTNGSFDVTLVVTDLNGCRDTLTRANYVDISRPTAAFTQNITNGCPGLTVDFTDTTLPDTTLTTWEWNFGDGFFSNQQHPSHTYQTPGVYDVTLVVTNAVGCRDTIELASAVEIYAPPTAQFTAPSMGGCRPFTWAPTDQSSAAAGANVVDWQWDFGNGASANIQSPSYTFDTAGVYTVTLIATDDRGCADTTFQSVTSLELPVADFSGTPRVGCSPQDVSFTDLTTGPNNLVQWTWDFGDGNTSNVQHPVHTYASDGPYLVRLRVEDLAGCRDTVFKTNYIRLSRPAPSFTVDDDEVCPGTPIHFTDTSVPDTTLTNWAWDFGDGNTSTAQHPTHSYAAAGTYDVQLIVTNVNGCSDTVLVNDAIEILLPPTPDFAVSDTAGCVPYEIAFTNTSIGTISQVSSFAWSFGDGDSSVLEDPVHTYTAAGTYTITLDISDDNGCTASTSQSITIHEVPTADFFSNGTSGCTFATVDFVNVSLGSAPLVSYAWSFGDGDSSSNQTPSHVYSTNGSFDVTLVVTDLNGCRDTLTRANYVDISRPTAAFTQNITNGCPGLTVDFTDTTLPDTTLTTWEWNFGDGFFSNQQHPSHTYQTPGVYDVTLVVTNAVGCRDTIELASAVEIYAPPTAQFTAPSMVGCRPFTWAPTDQSSAAAGANVVDWQWDFGNGASANIQSPSYTFDTAGVYTVTLIATDDRGCADTTFQSVTSLELPVADFSGTPRVGCSPQDVSFTDLTTGPNNLVQWTWDFGDGNTSNAQHPVHTYASDDTFRVELQVVDLFGCRDTVVRDEYIRLTRPTASFSLDETRGCPNLTVNFTDTSIPDTTLVSWLWNFGDGQASTDQHPSHTYANPGAYTVSLTITNVLGCTQTATYSDTLFVVTPPAVAFGVSDTAGCRPLAVAFSDSTVVASGSTPLASWAWNFGDGNSSTDQHPSHTYTTAGTYTVTLTTIDGEGCTGTSSTSITVHDLPQAAFVSNLEVGCAPQTVLFTDLSVGTANIVGWEWSFGDGKQKISQHPGHLYVADGIYDVQLVIFDQFGCSDTVVQPQLIRLSHPQAQFTSNTTEICPGGQVDFSDTSIPDTTIVSWLWDFGDGFFSNQQHPSHLYTASGMYDVSLVVTNALGCSDTLLLTDYIEVATKPATAFAPSDLEGCMPLAVDFTNNSAAATWPIVAYAWDFGDGNQSVVPAPSHTYDTAGTYTVELVATDQNGCTDTTRIDIEVHPLPTASFMSPDTLGCSPRDVVFVNMSNGPNTLTSHFWDFGDGNTSTLSFPTHTYAADGLYDVQLIVEDFNGCRDTMVRSEYIRLSRPVVDFSADQTEVCPGISIQFSDETIGDTTLASWLWEFGDGTASTDQNPTKLYTQAGQYTVRLTVTNVLGCSETLELTQLIDVIDPPVAAFTLASLEGCGSLTLDIANGTVENSHPVTLWQWDFGDGNTSGVEAPTHTWADTGTYVVQLIATDALGCADTTHQSVVIHPNPIAAFTPNDSLGCAPAMITFFDQSTGPAPFVQWQWNFGDGNTSNLPVPLHTYTADGIYGVSLIVTDLEGCTDTIVKPALIRLSHPVADFNVDQQSVCPATTVSFTDASTPDTTIVNWFWNFGDGTTGNGQHTSHTYTTEGEYDVTLIITNVLGCQDTIVKSNYIEIYHPPTVDFAASDTNGCVPQSIALTNLSAGNPAPIVSWAWDFGNGDTTSVQEPNIFYGTAGSYLVTLTAVDALGCTATDSLRINIYERPEADFASSDTAGCAEFVQLFDLTTSGNTLTDWQWTFGDGDTSYLQSPVHTYDQSGTYSVRLIVADEFGCRDTATKVDYITLTRPIASFAVDADVICPNAPLQFFDLSIPDVPLTNWVWDFGDGDTASGAFPIHTYTQPGTYTVTLQITNVFGCTDTETGVVEVIQPPIAQFMVPDIEGCAPFAVDFLDQSVGFAAPVIFWSWDFGDGNSSISQHPQHTYLAAGSYTTTLTVFDGNGCAADTTIAFTVNPIPVSDFTADRRRGCAPMTVEFSQLASGINGVSTFLWDFGDGNQSTQANPSHTYTADGDYTVTLVVGDVNGCSDTLVWTDFIRLSHPEIGFAFDPTNGCEQAPVAFSDTSQSDTTLVSWLWNFGDGNTATDQNPLHIYQDTGRYSVTLTVTDLLGCSSTDTVDDVIEVFRNPIAAFSPGDTIGCPPFDLQFFNQSTGTDAAIVAYKWDFMTGDTSNLVNPNYAFQTTGTYEMALIAIDEHGCQDTATTEIVVRPHPQPEFASSDTFGCAPATILFTDQTLSTLPITGWLWDFGDGNTSTAQFPTHSYASDGDYTVSLTVTDLAGCVGVMEKPDFIQLSHPTAEFAYDKDIICPGDTIFFRDESIADTTLVSWLWDFGDGNTSSDPSPFHAYITPGTYSVTLTITNRYGCSDQIVKADIIQTLQRPISDFTPSATSGCAPLQVKFTNTTQVTSAPIASWEWDFGDQAGSIFTNPNNTFEDPGTYDVRLIATDSYGCTDTTIQTLQSFVAPTANFAASDSIGCAPTTLNFLDQSQQGDGPITNWIWTFGDGNASLQQFTANSYKNDGFYDVSLVVVDANSCRDTLVKPAYIRLSHPQAEFATSSASVCPGELMSFVDQSIPDTTIVAWDWDFGDGSSSTDQNPTHLYSQAGDYAVTLTVTNVLGCSHSLKKQAIVEVHTPPTTVFTPSALSGCAPLTITLNDNSTGNSSPIVDWAWAFGDGDTSAAQNPNHTFTQPGTYTVSLTTTDNLGCGSSITRDITVHELPVANFMTPDTLGCAPSTITFSDLSSSTTPLASWIWDFGDGNGSSQQFPTHTFQTEGEYDITLTAIDANGCRDTLTREVYIKLSNPEAAFTFDVPAGCPGMEVFFTDESIADTTLISWAWDFGDGTGSFVRHPSHVYQTPGLYTVSLTVTNAVGCTHTIVQNGAISVSVPPVAAFSLSDTIGCAPFAPTFTDLTQTTSAPVVGWMWDFGNGDTSDLQEPFYSFTDAGTYEITLTVTDDLGCVDSAKQVVISTPSPTAEFMVLGQLGCAPFETQFVDQSSGEHLLTGWFWDFGDGNIATVRHPSHIYDVDGDYTVSLIVTDEIGCRDTVSKSDLIQLSHPDMEIVADLHAGCPGTTVTFEPGGIADTTLVGWFWDFGDGNTSILERPQHRYSQAGVYDVQLIVTNVLGCTDTVEEIGFIDIYQPPVAMISASDTNACVPSAIEFEDLSTSTAGIVSWEWYLDGISKGSSQQVSHFFQAEGFYDMSLQIVDANGCADTAVMTVGIRPIPVAHFAVSDTQSCSPAVLSFFDQTVHAPTQWLWDFGDGNTSTDQNPVHTYAEDGIYSVSLTVTDQFGCSDEFERINLINLDHPEASFSVDYDPSCPPVIATFTASGSGLKGIAKWEWNFGDGNTSVTTLDQVVHSYNTSGLYDVSLTATDSLGCTFTVTESQLVNVLGDVQPDLVSLHRVSVLSASQVEVIFSAYPEDDFDHYTIYREEPGQGYVPVYESFYVNDTLYIDQGMDTEVRSYCYKVTVTNHCGTESTLALSDRHCTIEAKAVPIPGQVLVSWTPYRGWDEVAQYEIYRVESYNLNTISFLGVVPGTTTRFGDVFEDCFVDVSYRIKAIGTREIEEAWSDTTAIFSEQGITGASNEIVRATVENNAEVLIEWKDFALPGLAIMYLEKAEDGGTFQTVATLPPGEEKFIDEDVRVMNHSYHYRMYAQDSCGNYTPYSNEAHTVVTTAGKVGSAPRLSWTPYEDWKFNVDAYRIEVFNDTSGQWEMVDRVQGTILEYIDTQTALDQPRYCYRIWAEELGGNGAVSLSNEICVDVETAVYAPSAFSPNGDGHNDVFYLSGFHVETYNLQIYSRWGMLLYETNNIDDGWDGTFGGIPVKEGVYVYVARGRGFNGRPYTAKGSITLMR
ncbi:PKD domain-containing protein [Pontibacter sp. G13]|uniref:PKD domain-containing protein n=1 Tax=Pontibacter sp. G13 TaxID=3074898 RepID=UPI00288ADD53|nr:PKD domain-containing protein [Pontibacter sp. G13]WNJ20360.1 PKD domain-containing protein [Pontibacter sp. G13]